jgi:hypothetical protein
VEARATLQNQSPINALVVLIAAVVAALMVGGAGGYAVRALTFSVQTTTTQVHRPFVVEQAPYSSPAASPAAQPTRDPRGFEVPI